MVMSMDVTLGAAGVNGASRFLTGLVTCFSTQAGSPSVVCMASRR